MTPAPLPVRSESAPSAAPSLTALVAQSRWPRNPKALQLEGHREELLQLRRAGESVAAICAGLRKLGVEVSDEALRLWLNRELGHKPMRRQKSRVTRDARKADAPSPDAAKTEPFATLSSATRAAADPIERDRPQAAAIAPASRPSSLILPGETPLQALRRRLAALDAERAAKVQGPN